MEIPAESLWAAVGRSRDPLGDIALFSRNYEANGSCTRALGDERLADAASGGGHFKKRSEMRLGLRASRKRAIAPR